jgi:hypothetical protein
MLERFIGTELNTATPNFKKDSVFRNLQMRMFTSFILALSFALFAITSFAQTTVTVNQTSIQGWVFYNDETDRIDPTLGDFVVGPATAPLGTGGVQISVTGTQRRNLATYQFSGTPLANITTLKYSTYNPSAGNGGSANRSGYITFNVDFNGSDTFQRRLNFVPSQNGTVVQNSWQEWDAINGGTAQWSYSGATWPVGIGGGGEPGTTLKTWSQILSQYPGVRIRVTDSFFGIRVGEPYPDGYTENIDAFKFGTSSGTTFFDFEPASSLSVSPAAVPNPFDNDYTRINNAVQAIGNGGTITLSGTFNWAEPNAAASWALGSDGQTGGAFADDDWTVLAPANLNGVTFTAASLGAATIQGPGDVAGANLEGVIQFYAGGTNQNWTISNLRFVDFDNPIGFYYAGGPTSVYSGTQILNNYILTARDLNATVAPADVNQNIGIHFAFGTNQIISGNTIEIHGDGVSDTANSRFSTEVGMQSNTSGGNAYNGLQITGNTVRVLNAQNNANPQVVLGIWENGHAHSSNVTVGGNQFLNAAGGNNPTINLQRGFRVTSHSSATTTVNYSNNVVQGANIGFQWLSVSGVTQPVRLTSNLILNNATGVKLDSGGLVNLSFNRIVGNSVAGVDNTLGTTATAENNWWGCNYGPGAGGAGCSGTANGNLGVVDANPWLTLRTSATPSAILTGGTSNISSNLSFNSDNVNTSGSGSVPNGTPASFSGTLGTVSPINGTTTAGVTGTTFTAGMAAGSGNAGTMIDGQTVNAPITSAFSCNNVSIPPTTSVTSNTQFTTPISIDSTNFRNILSYDFTVTYNPAVVTFVSATTAGTLSSGWTITTNNSSGTLVVSGFNTSPLSGSGVLLNLNFISTGGIGTTSNLNFSSFMLNEGVPCVNTSNGTVTIISGMVSGRVTYANAIVTTPVSGTTLNAAGSPPLSTSSDVNGLYTLSGFGAGAYTVTPSKSNQVNGISNLDASRVAQHIVGFAVLNPTQLIAADVTGNGAVTSLDAAYIAQFVAAIPNPGVTGTWKFLPANRAYANVVSSFTNQDYSAILMGEVTGNWNTLGPPIAPPIEVDDKETKGKTDDNLVQPVVVSAPVMQSVPVGTNFTISLPATDTTAEGILGYQFDLLYNQSVIVPQAIPCDVSGTLSSSLSAVCNPATPGILKVVVFGTMPINGAGTLIKLKFSAIGAGGTQSPLTFQNFMFNEGVPSNVTNNGTVKILAPTAASVSISGRLFAPNGRGVTNAEVRLTNSNGVTGTTRSGTFGYFKFDDVTAGEIVVISVNSKRFTFAPVTINVEDGIDNVNMFAEP